MTAYHTSLSILSRILGFAIILKLKFTKLYVILKAYNLHFHFDKRYIHAFTTFHAKADISLVCSFVTITAKSTVERFIKLFKHVY